MTRLTRTTRLGAALLSLGVLATAHAGARAADVADPQCFRPAAGSTVIIQHKAKPGPYRIALANGFIGNGWRVQMIQTLKAYAALPDVASQLKELRIVSVGTDVSAQIAAMDNFINAGFDAILVDANSPTAFKPVLRRARQAGVLVVAFDNTFDDVSKDPNVVQVNQDQREMGRLAAKWLLDTMKDGGKGAKVLEVRGVPGNSVDRDRHDGFVAGMGDGAQLVDVVGNWDDGAGQKVTADALSVNGPFAGIYTQGGSIGVTQALLGSGKPLIPVVGEGENGYRKLLAQHGKDGLAGDSIGQSPALVAAALKAAIAVLSGKAVPQEVSIPVPQANYRDLAAGKNYFPDLSDTFFAAYDYPVCGITPTAAAVMGQSAK